MLVLRYSDSDRQYSWFIRSLTSDGHFFGDLTDKKNLQQRNFRGMISNGDFSRIENNLQVLTSSSDQNSTYQSQLPFRFSFGMGLNDLRLRLCAETFDLIPDTWKEILEIIEPSLSRGLDCSVNDTWIAALRYQ